MSSAPRRTVALAGRVALITRRGIEERRLLPRPA
jgi:hypothetical protein